MMNMQIPLYISPLKKGSTKERILEILTEKRALSTQQIFSELKRRGTHKKYQTIREALLELVQASVLEKTGKEYHISIPWIKKMDQYVSFLKQRFIEKKSIKVIDKNTKEIELHSLHDLGHFVLYSFRDHFFDVNTTKDFTMYVHHLWFPFFDKEKRNALKNFFSENNNKIYVRSSSFFDRILSLFYKQYGSVKLGRTLDPFFDMIIQGDCIAKIYMPKELRERMDNFYRIRGFSFNAINELSELTFASYPIKIMIIRNKQMAEEMKKQLESS